MKEGHKTTWNTELLYSDPDDPAIERDMRVIESLCTKFEKKYSGKNFVASPEILTGALAEYESLMGHLDAPKSWWYFALRNRIDSGDNTISAKMTKYYERLTKARNQVTFFVLGICAISGKDQKRFLTALPLKHYRYFLENVFKDAKHMLTLEEEQLADLLGQTSYSMWITGQEKLLSAQMVLHKGKEVPIAEVQSILAELPDKERQALQVKITEAFKSISHFAEAEINAVYSFKKVMDERRGFKKPYDSTMLSHETDRKTVEALIGAVTGSFSVSRRFYKLHAKLLNKKVLSVADRAVKIGHVRKKFDFDSSAAIVRTALGRVDGAYASVFDEFMERGQIDAFPRKGKRGGAFCWGMGQLPTFVFLNHTDTINSVETFGHEMGHAIHSVLSKDLSPLYQGYSTATAEVASTFFEQVVTDELEQVLTEKDRMILLHSKIMGDISTIFRQIACFNFELELHETIRKEGSVSKETIARLLSKHLASYLGDAVKVTEDDGYFFVNWSHIRRFFYVYSYSYGQLISRSLFARWKADPSYAEKIAQFLRAGRTKSPHDIFKSIGVDTSDPKFWKDGIRSIEKDIEKLEKLSGKK